MKKNITEDFDFSKKTTETSPNPEEPENTKPSKEEDTPEKTEEAEAAPELSPLETAQKEAADSKNQYAYLRAEFDNYKKNTHKEQLRLIRFGAENLLLDILKIADLFDIALQTKITPENCDTVYSGFKMTAEEMSRSLENHGLKVILATDGTFDPHLHEAIGSEDSQSVPEGNIIKEVKRGYTLHDKVIRPSQVIVSSPQINEKNEEK